jgi:hypothetical protein
MVRWTKCYGASPPSVQQFYYPPPLLRFIIHLFKYKALELKLVQKSCKFVLVDSSIKARIKSVAEQFIESTPIETKRVSRSVHYTIVIILKMYKVRRGMAYCENKILKTNDAAIDSNFKFDAKERTSTCENKFIIPSSKYNFLKL